jgi:hypothetical protein
MFPLLLGRSGACFVCYVTIPMHQFINPANDVSITLLLLLLLFITFMQGIYNYVPETNNVSRVYSFAAILYVQFLLQVMLFPMLNSLYFYISAF